MCKNLLKISLKLLDVAQNGLHIIKYPIIESKKMSSQKSFCIKIFNLATLEIVNLQMNKSKSNVMIEKMIVDNKKIGMLYQNAWKVKLKRLILILFETTINSLNSLVRNNTGNIPTELA